VSPASPAARDEYTSERHVYEPHRAGLPPFRPYVRELWRRRGFAFELARTQMHAANTDTVFGQAWLVLNPLLLAGVYYLLVDVISQSKSRDPAQFFALLTSGLFLFSYITGSLQAGTQSITAGGRLILNTSFPKMLLTVSTVYQAFRRYLPSLAVFAVIFFITRQHVGWHLLWMFPILVLATLTGLGLANLFATLQVYFRDTASFLPYFIRIWLYMSPVLWVVPRPGDGGGHLQARLVEFGWANPLFGILASQGQVLIDHEAPDPLYLGYAVAWALALLVGGSLVLMSREREFAVRL
jgi:teichoic acid transport system permease protein